MCLKCFYMCLDAALYCTSTIWLLVVFVTLGKDFKRRFMLEYDQLDILLWRPYLNMFNITYHPNNLFSSLAQLSSTAGLRKLLQVYDKSILVRFCDNISLVFTLQRYCEFTTYPIHLVLCAWSIKNNCYL